MTKTIIISDVHFTVYFNRKKLEFFKKLIASADQVIINGDFWSYYSVTFDQFINSRWKELFPLFKAKNTIYLYGNHDQKRWTDERVAFFSTKQAVEYKLKCGERTFLITHGDKLTGFPTIDTKSFTTMHRFFHVGAPQYSIETLLLKFLGPKLYKPAQKYNDRIKEYSRKLKDGEYLVTGHTHLAEIDMKNKFINSGFIHSGVASYIVLEDCTPRIVNERYDWGILQ